MRIRADYHRARNLDEALELKTGRPDSAWIAGGTDVLVLMKDGVMRAGHLVSLRAVDDLRQLDPADGLRFGAAVSVADILASPGLAERYSSLHGALRVFASPQIRNVATVGGNICRASPGGDSSPALLVHGARLLLRGPDGERELGLEDFFRGPGQTALAEDELLIDLWLPPPAAGSRSAFRRLTRVSVDVALVSIAACVELEDDGRTCRSARVAAGAVAPTPLRLGAVEDLLAGERLDDPDLLSRAADLVREGISPITDLRASADYRRHVAGVLCERALTDCVQGSPS